MDEREMVEAWRQTAIQLARDVKSLARDGGMPDSFYKTDSRMSRVQSVLEFNEPLQYDSRAVATQDED